MTSWDRFIETSVPPKDAFFNKLRGQALRNDEYAHAQKVLSRCGCKTILDYLDIYLKCMSTHISTSNPLLPTSTYT